MLYPAPIDLSPYPVPVPLSDASKNDLSLYLMLP